MLMKWRSVSAWFVAAVLIITSCKAKQSTIEAHDFARNLSSSAAHQRLLLQDTISFFRFLTTDSGTVSIPAAQVVRHARAQHTQLTADTAAYERQQNLSQIQLPCEEFSLPWWANKFTYMLIVILVYFWIIAYMARKQR